MKRYYRHRVTGVRYGMHPLFARNKNLELVEEPDEPVKDELLGKLEATPAAPARRRQRRQRKS